ncbi:MAG: DegT/DnrJ/EryC1/StrS family aminotransferase [Armatimonadetes bacterium]|nr:DegT/DnrJ/EryC1/StrS family aminotransferase [Armatimonadota bacterium]
MSELALLGGPKAVTVEEPDWKRWPIVTEEEEQAVLEVLRSGSWSIPPVTREFEREFAEYIGTSYALAHNNGTSALHAAMFAVGVGPGDEVIAPSYTWWASIMPALSLGAIPVFAEVEERTLCIDPEDVARKITPRTKAIMVVHLHGMPADMDAILSLAREKGVAVIEDASHAHGAKLHGKRIGSFGDVAAFSLQTSKLLPAGEGGVLVTDTVEYYERAVLLGHYERIDELTNERYRRYKWTCYGFKYRMNPLAAAIARVQLRHLDERNAKRNANVKRFHDGIRDLPGLKVLDGLAGAEPVYYQHPILYEASELGGLPRERFIEALSAEGAVGFSPERYEGLHLQQIFLDFDRDGASEMYRVPRREDGKPRYGPGTLPKTEEIVRRVILAPTFRNASEELVDQYVAAVRKVVEHHRDLL